MQGLTGKQKTLPLHWTQAPLDERQVSIGICAVEFVAHQRMTQVSEVNADLMLPSGVEAEADHGKPALRTVENVFPPPPGPGGRPVQTHPIPDSNLAPFVLPQWLLTDSMAGDRHSVDEGAVLFGDQSEFP